MRYFLALPLALLTTPGSLAFEPLPSAMSTVGQEKQETDTFRDFMSGLEHYNGWGDTAQDYQEAMTYFELAARGGHNQAQHYLGLMYYKGLGVKKDNVEAYKWFDLAASNGDKVGVVLKLTLKDLLTPSEIVEAESRAQEWLHATDTQ